jgi:hypothetical protein
MLRRTLLASTLAVSLAACAPQPVTYTLYRLPPGVVWPGSAPASLPQPSLSPLLQSVDDLHANHVSVAPTPVTSPDTMPPRRHYQQPPVVNDDVPDTPVPAPAYPHQTVHTAIPSPEPPSSENWCTGWWRLCHII